MQRKIMSANLSTLKTQTYHLCKHQRVICLMWSHLVRKTYLDKIPTKFVTWKGVKAIYFSRTWQALTFPIFARGILVQCSYLWWMKEKFLIFNLMRKCGIFYWATDGENVQNVDFEWTKMEKKTHKMKQGKPFIFQQHWKKRLRY